MTYARDGFIHELRSYGRQYVTSTRHVRTPAFLSPWGVAMALASSASSPGPESLLWPPRVVAIWAEAVASRVSFLPCLSAAAPVSVFTQGEASAPRVPRWWQVPAIAAPLPPAWVLSTTTRMRTRRADRGDTSCDTHASSGGHRNLPEQEEHLRPSLSWGRRPWGRTTADGAA